MKTFSLFSLPIQPRVLTPGPRLAVTNSRISKDHTTPQPSSSVLKRYSLGMHGHKFFRDLHDCIHKP